MIRAVDRFLTNRPSLFESIESPKMFMLLMFRVMLFKNGIFTSFMALLPSEFSQMKAYFLVVAVM